MELERAVDERIAAMTTAAEGKPAVIGPHRAEISHLSRLDASVSTPMLRLCTALAARARVELLSENRHAATDELSALLDTMGGWESELLDAPDPTMTVLCAAALQDLAERLPDPGAELSARVDAVLELLHGVMEDGRVVASA
ncbi:MAG: hypothetical protein ACTH0H_03525 [Brachybacterium sp.]